MKKTYQTPKASVTEIAALQMIAESLTYKSGNITNVNSVLTKEDNSWDVWGDDDFRDE